MINLAALRAHVQTCGIVAYRMVSDQTPNKEEGYSLNLGATNIESGLSETLNEILQSCNLSMHDKDEGVKMIARYTAEQAISPNRSREEVISPRKSDELLYTIPVFTHTEKPNINKALTALGKVGDHEKFNPNITSCMSNSVKNFEMLELILKRVEKLILIGSL